MDTGLALVISPTGTWSVWPQKSGNLQGFQNAFVSLTIYINNYERCAIFKPNCPGKSVDLLPWPSKFFLTFSSTKPLVCPKEP